MSNKREPLSNATSDSSGGGSSTAGSASSYRVRPAVSPAFNNGRYQGAWDDPEQPFDFMLELSDVERAPAPPAIQQAYEVRAEGETGESNLVTKPPPPTRSGTRDEIAERPSLHAYSPDRDWDEVTPRSTSVAAALLSSPQQIEAPPVSSEADPSSNTPSTEPTGGRHPEPKPRPDTSETSTSRAAFALAAPVPFPLTGPAAFPIPTPLPTLGAPARLATPLPTAVASPSPVPTVQAPVLSPVHSAAPFPMAASGLPVTPATVESLSPVSRSEPAPSIGYKFAPSFTIDNAPITTRGTYKREMEASVRERKPLSKWAPTVIAAFVLPFVGASMLTSWFESQRRTTGATTEQGLAAQAASPVPPHTDLPGASPPPDVAEAAGAGANADEPVILPQSLEAAAMASEDKSATITTATRPGVHPQGRVKSRPALDSVDFSAGLTSQSKSSQPSYRVKIPDEQNAPELRNGAHNVPVNE